MAAAVHTATLPIGDATDGLGSAELVISVLPGRDTSQEIAPLIDLRSEADNAWTAAPVQLLESNEYRFEIVTSVRGQIWADRPELFESDDASGRAGRIKTGLFTGTVPVRFSAGEEFLGHVQLEVRSRKLDYLKQYRWMLQNIAAAMSELILERFAASEQQLTLDAHQDSRSLYQRFAFLKSILESEEFDAALHHIEARPYFSWRTETEQRPPSAGVKASSHLIRQLSRPGPRHDGRASSNVIKGIRLPLRLEQRRTEETLDNTPNRFIRFALSKWRAEVALVLERMNAENDGSIRARGVAEASALLTVLDRWLESPVLREVGSLHRTPVGDQVLQKRAGYRDIFRSYLESELAASLTWEGGESVYGAGKKNVAALYEYWVFLQLAKLCGEICEKPFDASSLIASEQDGFHIRLRKGRGRVVTRQLIRNERRISVELWFNRQFAPDPVRGSWTTAMRPDCSFRFAMEPGIGSADSEVWIHFDAKYRADKLRDVFPETTQALDEELPENTEDSAPSVSAKRDDLHKMHAYRDAIRRSAGAYVLYPGPNSAEKEPFREYHEILPGLGAFPLQPRAGGEASGIGPLRAFLYDVVDHLSSQATGRERALYWKDAAYSGRTSGQANLAVNFLERPPADTGVLLGYVRGSEHWGWIEKTQRYNLRADGRRGSVGLDGPELGARLVLLYDASGRAAMWQNVGRPEIWDRDDMHESGYGNPRSAQYICLPLAVEPVVPLPAAKGLRHLLAERWPGQQTGRPRVVSWLEIAQLAR